MNTFGKRKPIIAFLILQIIIYLSIINVNGASALSVLENVPYPFYPAMNSNLYQVDVNVGFNLNPSKTPQVAGTAISEGISEDINLIKALYYGYLGPGNVMGNLTQDQQKTYTHLLASYIYSGDMAGFNFYTLMSYFNCNLIDYYNQLPYLGDPNHYELGFTEDNLVFTSDGMVQRSNSIRLVATEWTWGYFDLPAGLTLVNETSGTTTSSQRCYLQAQDMFHFEASPDYLGEVEILDFYLNLNVFNYQVRLVKTQGTVDLADPNNDGYATVGSLIRTPTILSTALSLDFQFKPKVVIKTMSDSLSSIADQMIKITGPDSFEKNRLSDDAGEVELVNLEPGTYYITATDANFPYKENIGTYSVTVDFRQKKNVEVIFEEIHQATARYHLNMEDPPLLVEDFNVQADYGTVGFDDFSMEGYSPISISVVKDGVVQEISNQTDEVANGIVIEAVNFPDYLTFESGSYYLDVNIEADLTKVAIPLFDGRNGVIDVTMVDDTNLREMIFTATSASCHFQEDDVTESMTIVDLNIERFNKPGVAVVEFDYLSPDGLHFKTSYNVLVVDLKTGDQASLVRFIDKENLNELNSGFFGTDTAAKELLGSSLDRQNPAISYQLDDKSLKMIKNGYLEDPDFDIYQNETIANSMTKYDNPIEDGQITVTQTGSQAILVFEGGETVDDNGVYMSISKYQNGQVECLLGLKDGYFGSLRLSLDDMSTDLTGAIFEGVVAQSYDGTPKYPIPVIYLQDRKLIPGRDFQLAYSSNVSVGEATINVMGIDDYQGGFTIKFQIEGE